MPLVARRVSSSQSVMDQPVVPPSAIPRHQGVTSPLGWSAAILSVSATTSSQVVGIS